MTARTGYAEWRDEPHRAAVTAVTGHLERIGYVTQEEPTDGHRPDIRIAERDEWVFADIKTGTPNIAIELESLDEYRRIQLAERRRVYIIHVPDAEDPQTWTVDTPDSLSARIVSGPRRTSGHGSNDDWYLVQRGGQAITDYFPSRLAA